MWASLIGAVAGPILGGLLGSESSENASDAQIQAGNDSNATQLQMFNQTRADMAPWREAGVNALGQISKGIQPGGNLLRPFQMSDYTADPGYNFRLSEGIKALDRSAAKRGNLLSGGALKGITRYGQDMASNEYANAYNRFNQDQANQFNRLASVSGLGQTTAQQIGSMGTQVAGQVGNTQQGMGNARASGYVGAGNALSGGLSSAYNNYQSGQLMNRLFPGASGSNGGYPGIGGYQSAYDNDVAQFGSA